MNYSTLTELYEQITSTSKRLLKTKYLSDFIKKSPIEDLDILIRMVRGKVFADYEEEKLGISSKIILKVISLSTGMTAKEVEDEWKKTGDLGIVAENLVKTKKQVTLFSNDLTVNKVYDNIRRLPNIDGHGSVDTKIKIISELLTSAKPAEAKYIVRTVLEEMRVGIGDGLVRDAFLWTWFGNELNINFNEEKNVIDFTDEERLAYNKYSDNIQRAFDITNDFSKVGQLCVKGIEAVENVNLEIGNPIKVMLCPKVADVNEAFEKLGSPIQVEYKYDGFRVQIHKSKKGVVIFTRSLENVTIQFPEVKEYVEKNISGYEFIIDCEAVGFDEKTQKYMPFQHISQRIKRKHGIEELSKKLPVELNVFDLLYYEGESLIKKPLNKRVEKLESIITPIPKKIVLARKLITNDANEAQKFYNQALDDGEEGVIIKKVDSEYKPGKRVGGWVKLKPVMEALDVVITGAEWGEGKRSEWMTSFAIAIVDEFGEFLEIGKVGTGIKELEGQSDDVVTFDKLTELLKPLIIEENGKEVMVRPHIVIEVNYEEIQKSTTYSSGYALRFPRLIRLREDRNADGASTAEMVEEFYYGQK
ncbi:DNA ligase [Candidatus Woesearchaeota archaeon]|nr:MAG: DNA ligase [Candidatus Woesearchaeota archaeon]